MFFFSLPLPSWRLARLEYQFDTTYLDKGHGVKEASFFVFFFFHLDDSGAVFSPGFVFSREGHGDFFLLLPVGLMGIRFDGGPA